jgi:hypothetical protein
VVNTAFVCDEKPTCCRFLEKYSAVLEVVIFLLEEDEDLGVDAAAFGAGASDEDSFLEGALLCFFAIPGFNQGSFALSRFGKKRTKSILKLSQIFPLKFRF